MNDIRETLARALHEAAFADLRFADREPERQEQYRELGDRLLARLRAAGLGIAPLEPSDEMVQAGLSAAFDPETLAELMNEEVERVRIMEVYGAMLKAESHE